MTLSRRCCHSGLVDMSDSADAVMISWREAVSEEGRGDDVNRLLIYGALRQSLNSLTISSARLFVCLPDIVPGAPAGWPCRPGERVSGPVGGLAACARWLSVRVLRADVSSSRLSHPALRCGGRTRPHFAQTTAVM